MRIWPARVFGPAMMVGAAAFLTVTLGIAQQGGTTGGTGGGTGGGAPTSPGKGTPTPTPTPTPRTGTTNPNTTETPQIPRMIWISGRVALYDGTPPPESVTIERVCSTNSVHAEGYTDSQGRFSFNLGQSNGAFADASTNSYDSFGAPGGFSSMSGNSGGGGGRMSSSNSETAYWDCELRARLPGYRSETISLAGRRMLDAPDVGVIILYPISKIQGLTESATSGQAPKAARKGYEKGVKAAKKNKLDEAEQEFRKAVQGYPKYAEAWFELGKVLEKKERYPEAREAYASALAADSKYVYPYQQLYQMALREQNWQELAERTDQLLHLDPYEFPTAYYFNALAHLQLKEYDAAEKSAHQAVDADWKKSNPRIHFLLGAILIQKQSWTEAAASFRAYLKASPNANDRAQVEKTLGQLDQQISRVRPVSQDSAAQQ